MSDEEFVHYTKPTGSVVFSDEENEENEEIEEKRALIPPKKTAAYRQRVMEHQSPLAELLVKQPTDQAIFKSIQESCERQELLLNKALEKLASQRTQMNELTLRVTALQQARMEEAAQATISTNQLKPDKGTAETTSATIETKENGKQMTKNIGIEQKKLLWVRYTMVVDREDESASYPLLLCLGQCERIGPHSRNYVSLVEYDFFTTETTVMLILKPSPTIYKRLKKTYGLTLESPQFYDLAKQGLKYWQLIGDKQLVYLEDYVTSPDDVSLD